MKAKTKFLKMYYKMPKEARNLVWFFGVNMYTLNPIKLEVEQDTELGDKILKDMGFTNDD